MPNVKELQSLMDYGVPFPGPTVDATFPGATAAGSYWSSTPNAGFSSDAWFVNFFGSVVSFGGKGNSLRVRAVRGGR